jgi:hypothetical protein
MGIDWFVLDYLKSAPNNKLAAFGLDPEESK